MRHFSIFRLLCLALLSALVLPTIASATEDLDAERDHLLRQLVTMPNRKAPPARVARIVSRLEEIDPDYFRQYLRLARLKLPPQVANSVLMRLSLRGGLQFSVAEGTSSQFMSITAHPFTPMMVDQWYGGSATLSVWDGSLTSITTSLSTLTLSNGLMLELPVWSNFTWSGTTSDIYSLSVAANLAGGRVVYLGSELLLTEPPIE